MNLCKPKPEPEPSRAGAGTGACQNEELGRERASERGEGEGEIEQARMNLATKLTTNDKTKSIMLARFQEEGERTNGSWQFHNGKRARLARHRAARSNFPEDLTTTTTTTTQLHT